MIVALLGCLEGDAGFLKQIALNVASCDVPRRRELDPNELSLHCHKVHIKHIQVHVSRRFSFKTQRIGEGRRAGKKEKLTKREELLLRMVWAFPKDSRIGLAWRIWLSRRPIL